LIPFVGVEHDRHNLPTISFNDFTNPEPFLSASFPPLSATVRFQGARSCFRCDVTPVGDAPPAIAAPSNSRIRGTLFGSRDLPSSLYVAGECFPTSPIEV